MYTKGNLVGGYVYYQITSVSTRSVCGIKQPGLLTATVWVAREQTILSHGSSWFADSPWSRNALYYADRPRGPAAALWNFGPAAEWSSGTGGDSPPKAPPERHSRIPQPCAMRCQPGETGTSPSLLSFRAGPYNETGSRPYGRSTAAPGTCQKKKCVLEAFFHNEFVKLFRLIY